MPVAPRTDVAYTRAPGEPSPPLDTIVVLIRPFQLHIVVADLLELPGADVTNLTIIVVVPPLAGDRIRDSFCQFVGGSARQGIECIQPTEAARTAGIGHHGVVYLLAIDIAVVATEGLTRPRASL